MTPLDVLRRHWGYPSFRPPQDAIIDSVLEGCDTLGLMPTGGGKSLTFQVPAMMLDGLTVVVTPLISLMKDQVDSLAAVGIRACALHSMLTRREYKLALDRCRLGKARLLYVSPEKLRSEGFAADIRLCRVSLIVVDEAHCISQWGYDFRPSYLQIRELRKQFPEAPVLALTASATPEVVDDIRRQLDFRPGARTFAKSFARDNISWLVRHTPDKESMLLRILAHTRGSAIVYARSRRRTLELAALLSRNGIPALFYHAGLGPELRAERQNLWKSGQAQVMVATNAFGMGIDKPDVRTVVHWDVPPSLEEYYQEAGRAGRDGLESWAVLLANATDKATLARRLGEAFPEKEFVARVYELAMNFLSMAVGSGYNTVHQFDTDRFCLTFRLPPRPVRSALRLLTMAGYVEYVDDAGSRPRMMVICDKRDLYSLQLDPVHDTVFQTILRSYTGLFADYVDIDEDTIASRCGLTRADVYSCLIALNRMHAIHYIPRSEHPTLYLPMSRVEPRFVKLPRAVYEEQRERMERRIDGVRRYAWTDTVCRPSILLDYFGEKRPEGCRCGKCDWCRAQGTSAPASAPAAEAAAPALTEQEVLRLADAPAGITVDRLMRYHPAQAAQIPGLLRRLAAKGAVILDGLTVRLPG